MERMVLGIRVNFDDAGLPDFSCLRVPFPEIHMPQCSFDLASRCLSMVMLLE
jgi:hypothetical protein